MSKQAKLAALIHRVQEYAHGVGLVGPLGTRVKDAYCEYEATPDDPPHPPELPECVRALVSHLKGNVWYSQNINEGVAAIEAHYAQPLKLEVGKVYEDANGNVIDIVWQEPKNPSHFIGVSRLEGVPWWYLKDGTAKSDHLSYAGASIIREVKS